MADELTIKEESGLAGALSRQEIGELLRPLVREIHLFDTWVAGTARLPDPEILSGIRPGDRLTLLRRPSKFDENEICLIAKEGGQIGYVPEKDELIFARLMDGGKRLTAKVNGVEKRGGLTQIAIGIFLTDF